MEYIGDLMNLKGKIFLVVIVIAGIAFLGYPASAESGQLHIQQGTSTTYTPTSVVGGLTPLWNTLKVDSADFNSVTHYYIIDSELTLGSNARSSSFTITSGGTGSGIVSYDKPATRIDWYFSNVEITSSPLVLSYDTNIFSDVSDCGNGVTSSPSSTQPILIQTNTGQSLTRCQYTDITQHADVQKDFYNNYTVTYSNVDLGVAVNVSISKTIAGSVQSKINILNSTTSKFLEPTFNTNPLSYSFIYDSGIALNMSDVSGNYDFLVVNATSYTGSGVLPSPAPTPTPNQFGVGMVFDSTTYIQGGTANLSWLRIIPTPISLEDHIEVTSPTGKITYAQTNPPDSGYAKFILDEIGTYQAKFIRCSFFCLLSYTLATATTNVPSPGASYILINSTMSAFTPTDITYYNGNVPTSKKVVMGEYWEPATNSYKTVYIGNFIYQQEGTFSFICDRITKYKFYVEGAGQDYFSDCILNNSHPQYNISTSNLTLSSYNVVFGDWIGVSYEIDSVNFTGNRTYLSINDSGGQELFNITLPQQRDYNVQWRISDTSDLNAYMRFKPGINTIKMVAAGRILDSHIVIVSSVDGEGYGLEIKESYCTNESKTFKYYSPGTVNLSISKDGVEKRFYILNASIPGRIIAFSLPNGEYTFSMTVNAIQKRTAQTVIGSCDIAVTPNPYTNINGTWTPTNENIKETCSYWDTWVRAVFESQGINDVTRLLFALGTIVAMMFIGLIASKGNFGVAVILGFFPYAFFSYMTLASPCGQYIPLWINIFIALIIGIKMRWFS